MALSYGEERILARMEHSLLREDPAYAERVEAILKHGIADGRDPGPWRRLQSLLLRRAVLVAVLAVFCTVLIMTIAVAKSGPVACPESSGPSAAPSAPGAAPGGIRPPQGSNCR